VKIVKQTFGDMLKSHRERAGLNRRQLALKAGINPAYLQRIETEIASPSWDTVCKLADALQISIAAFR